MRSKPRIPGGCGMERRLRACSWRCALWRGLPLRPAKVGMSCGSPSHRTIYRREKLPSSYLTSCILESSSDSVFKLYLEILSSCVFLFLKHVSFLPFSGLGTADHTTRSVAGFVFLLFLTCLIFSSLCRMARACLNLMAAMVTQGPEAARDVCSHFDLNKKTLYTLATKRDSKVRSSERLVPPVYFLSLWRAIVVCLSSFLWPCSSCGWSRRPVWAETCAA